MTDAKSTATPPASGLITLTHGGDGIALIVIDCPGTSVNVFSAALTHELSEAVETVLGDPSVNGVILTSGKAGFMAGADLKACYPAIAAHLDGHEETPLQFPEENRLLRRIETGGKPFACAINGTALGGGLELALACHHRVLSDDPDTRVGLPEVSVGLLPAGGGTQRLPRLIGIEAALPLLVEGTALNAEQALRAGIVDALAEPPGVIDACRRWLLGRPDAAQPWDKDGYRIPGGAGPLAEHAMRSFYAGMAKVRQRTQNNYPAPLAILRAVYEGTQLPFEQALDVEAACFRTLVQNPVARNLIRTQFIGARRHAALTHRPAGIAAQPVRRLAILGAGMMGTGIAYAAAAAGIDVVVLDATPQQAAAAAAKIRKIALRMGGKGDPDAHAAAIQARITCTADFALIAGADALIEAVFEDRAVKQRAFADALRYMAPGALIATNTSTLPVSGLARYVDDPTRFIGMHFFSPVERMPLLEIIMGEQTSQATLAHAMDLARRLRKTPIVVNDSPGFYTSRVFCTYVDEAMIMLREGVAPALIENAARMAGFAVPPLAVLDEVSLDLQKRVVDQAVADGLDARFRRVQAQPAIEAMNRIGRLGRKSGGGFYVFSDEGGKHLWPGLAELFPVAARQPDVHEVRDRLLYIQALESVRCLDEGVISAGQSADIGATLGLGFPAWTGGPISFIDSVGLTAFLRRCEALKASCGARFDPPASLVGQAREHGSFYVEEGMMPA